jgi:hypothetical protein
MSSVCDASCQRSESWKLTDDVKVFHICHVAGLCEKKPHQQLCFASDIKPFRGDRWRGILFLSPASFWQRCMRNAAVACDIASTAVSTVFGWNEAQTQQSDMSRFKNICNSTRRSLHGEFFCAMCLAHGPSLMRKKSVPVCSVSSGQGYKFMACVDRVSISKGARRQIAS